MTFAWQGCIFLEVLFSKASREGKQGCSEPHALAHSDKALRSQRYAFMHDPLLYSIALAQRHIWSGTPIKAWLSPAAAHCAELRSFRRGCMALRSREDNM